MQSQLLSRYVDRLKHTVLLRHFLWGLAAMLLLLVRDVTSSDMTSSDLIPVIFFGDTLEKLSPASSVWAGITNNQLFRLINSSQSLAIFDLDTGSERFQPSMTSRIYTGSGEIPRALFVDNDGPCVLLPMRVRCWNRTFSAQDYTLNAGTVVFDVVRLQSKIFVLKDDNQILPLVTYTSGGDKAVTGTILRALTIPTAMASAVYRVSEGVSVNVGSRPAYCNDTPSMPQQVSNFVADGFGNLFITVTESSKSTVKWFQVSTSDGVSCKRLSEISLPLAFASNATSFMALDEPRGRLYIAGVATFDNNMDIVVHQATYSNSRNNVELRQSIRFDLPNTNDTVSGLSVDNSTGLVYVSILSQNATDLKTFFVKYKPGTATMSISHY